MVGRPLEVTRSMLYRRFQMGGRPSITTTPPTHGMGGGDGDAMTGMESSTTMPRVESSSGRLAIPADLIQRIERWSATYGLSREEGAELVLRGTIDPIEPVASRLRHSYETRDVQTPEQVSSALARAEVEVPVVGIRLGPRRPIGTEAEPFSRDHLGADLLDDPLEVWPAARGLWRMSDRPRVIVAYRLGHPLAVYRVPGWEQDPGTGRRWAATGHVLTSDQRMSVAGTDSGAATDADRSIVHVVSARPLVTPPAAANPIVWLHGR